MGYQKLAFFFYIMKLTKEYNLKIRSLGYNHTSYILPHLLDFLGSKGFELNYQIVNRKYTYTFKYKNTSYSSDYMYNSVSEALEIGIKHCIKLL